MQLRARWIAVLASLGLAVWARGETAYFLAGDPVGGPVDRLAQGFSQEGFQSYVVAVSDPADIARARNYLSAGEPSPLVPMAHVALGADGINRNYSQPGQPAWDWHVTTFDGWTTVAEITNIPSFLAYRDLSPAGVPAMIQGGAPKLGYDFIRFTNYPLLMELKLGQTGNLLNVSNRGYVGTGERVLIAGFVVGSGAPRNVLVRGIGPSLGPLGVAEPLADPIIDVYRGGKMIATNDNWKSGNLWQIDSQGNGTVRPEVAAFVPVDDKEAAVRLLLPPGSYSVIVHGATNGIALAEVFDLDALQVH